MRSRFPRVLVVAICFLETVALAKGEVVRWGGPGYDPASAGKNHSSLFSARPDLTAGGGKSYFEIWVDSEKTVKGVGSMVFRQQGRKDISSGFCYKAQKHITAPYACRFKRKDFINRAGIGTLTVYSEDGQELLHIFADITRIKQAF